MPPGFPALPQANADRLGRAHSHVRPRVTKGRRGFFADLDLPQAFALRADEILGNERQMAWRSRSVPSCRSTAATVSPARERRAEHRLRQSGDCSTILARARFQLCKPLNPRAVARHPASRHKQTHPSPSAHEFRLLLKELATSALRRMFCSDDGACCPPAGRSYPAENQQ